MAGIDYASCEECGKRLFYDGDWAIREYMRDNTKTITCDHCVAKLKKKIAKLEKHRQNRR